MTDEHTLADAFDRQAAQFERAPVQSDPALLARVVAFAELDIRRASRIDERELARRESRARDSRRRSNGRTSGRLRGRVTPPARDQFADLRTPSCGPCDRGDE